MISRAEGRKRKESSVRRGTDVFACTCMLRGPRLTVILVRKNHHPRSVPRETGGSRLGEVELFSHLWTEGHLLQDVEVRSKTVPVEYVVRVQVGFGVVGVGCGSHVE